MEILMSVLGIGELGAATLITEIGDFKDFSSGISLLHGLIWFRICTNQRLLSYKSIIDDK